MNAPACPVTMTPALQVLYAQVQQQLAQMAYPNRSWVVPATSASGEHVYDVLIVGAGQAGLATAFALQRDGVDNIKVIDARPAGAEGVWENFARMTHLRTPKATVGIEAGVPALSAPAFYKARYGEEAWAGIDRIERTRWMEFLRWFRFAAGIQVSNSLACTGIAPEGEWVRVRVAPVPGAERAPDAPDSFLTRHVVLASGFDGAGAWHVPPDIAAAVSSDRLNHSNGPIDFVSLKGKRVGVLGHGASAFDNAAVALEHGAASVDLCFRREQIPTINPHRRLEFAGFLKHFHKLDDSIRWRTNRFFEVHDQPPTQQAWDRACAFPNFRVHPGSPWQEVRQVGDLIMVKTPRACLTFDHIICATGAIVDYNARAELKPLAALVKRWKHVYSAPPGEESAALAEFPYLDAAFEYQPLNEKTDAWVRRVKAFNFSSVASMGPHTTSASGHKYAIPRLVAGITEALMLGQAQTLLPALETYREVELQCRRPVLSSTS